MQVCGVFFLYYCNNNKNWSKWFIKHVVFVLNVLCLFELWVKKNPIGIIYNFYEGNFFIYINK